MGKLVIEYSPRRGQAVADGKAENVVLECYRHAVSCIEGYCAVYANETVIHVARAMVAERTIDPKNLVFRFEGVDIPIPTEWDGRIPYAWPEGFADFICQCGRRILSMQIANSRQPLPRPQ